MAGRKVFVANEVLTAAEVNSYLMDQSVMVFADASARTAAIGTPTAGMMTFRADGTVVEVYNGAAWSGIDTTISSINGTAVVNTLTASTATAYEILSEDQGTYMRFTGASAVITVGTATAFTAGQQVQIIDAGGGMTITAGTGVTFQGAGTSGTALTATLGAQYEAVSILAVDSDTYSIIGNVSLA